MKGNRNGYQDIALKIDFVQMLTLSRASEISVLIKGQCMVLAFIK